jgi:cytochrome-b5 reductase
MMSRGTRSDLKTRFTLLHSSRTPADLPPPFILQRLSSLAETNPDWFKLHLFVDSHDGSKPCHKLHVARIDEKAIRTFGLDHRPDTWWRIFCSPGGPGRKDRKRLFIVCGPEP